MIGKKFIKFLRCFFGKFKISQFYSEITWPLKQTNDFEDIDPGIGRDQNSEENLYENQAYLEPDNLEISRNREKGKRLSPDHHQSNNNAIYANDSVVSSSTTFLRLLEIPCPFKIHQLQGRLFYPDYYWQFRRLSSWLKAVIIIFEFRYLAISSDLTYSFYSEFSVVSSTNTDDRSSGYRSSSSPSIQSEELYVNESAIGSMEDSASNPR